MKRLLVALVLLGSAFTLSAQLKIGYVDSNTIMSKLPDATDAQARLDALIAEWQEELRKMEDEWQSKYNDYDQRKLIMSDQKRSETEKELVALETKITSYRQQKFGPTGDLFKKQTELMEPVQNKVFNVIQEVAEDLELDFVFDKSGDIIFLYTKPEHDITPLVLEKLEIEQ
ncbi:MAG: OmpH family outer membrane protein [Melioribacteraceae bacterium]|nr:OmpH family outer membrane protein [Melioribacteraceae bacterium]WKZ68555.1 MAG: OmpH family outer membrane protein [Melioribacteraceae bacterium]